MPLKLMSKWMAKWKNCVYNPFLILYILWLNTVDSRFSSPVLAVVGQCYKSQTACGPAWVSVRPWRPCLKHSLWDTTVLLYFQTDHCSKQCWGIAWAARALEGQEEAPGLLMMGGQSQCKWLPNLGGAKSLQWFRSVWSQHINDYFQCLFYVIIISQHNAIWPKIKR